MYVCMYVCMSHICVQPQLSSYLGYSLTYVKKQTIARASEFKRDTHPIKPKECLDDDGVGFQEALAEHIFHKLWSVTRRRCLLPYTNKLMLVRTNSIIPRLTLFSVTLILFAHFLTRHNRQHVQVASRANQGLWEPPHT